MSLRRLDVGFVPLVDAAPLIVAREFGFAAEEGLDLALHVQPSWSALRDKLAFGRLDAAHLLAPMAVAMAIGLGGAAAPVEVLSILSVNGQVIGASPRLAARMRDAGAPDDFADARGVGRALLAAAPSPLRVGAPFPFSMHAELLYYWLGARGLAAPQGMDMRTIPPARMADAIAADEVDLFCVGEPWGTAAVERGGARLILPGNRIWAFAPDKALAVRAGWAEREPEAAALLLRACWRAARWLSDPANHAAAAEVMARADNLNVGSEIIDRALSGRLRIAADGSERAAPRFVEFFAGAATFPWRSQALWIADRLATRTGLDRREAAKAARACFRPDLYRKALGPIGAPLPGASEKLEGALDERAIVAASGGELSLGPDRFFDGAVFDPVTLP